MGKPNGKEVSKVVAPHSDLGINAIKIPINPTSHLPILISFVAKSLMLLTSLYRNFSTFFPQLILSFASEMSLLIGLTMLIFMVMERLAVVRRQRMSTLLERKSTRMPHVGGAYEAISLGKFSLDPAFLVLHEQNTLTYPFLLGEKSRPWDQQAANTGCSDLVPFQTPGSYRYPLRNSKCTYNSLIPPFPCSNQDSLSIGARFCQGLSWP